MFYDILILYYKYLKALNKRPGRLFISRGLKGAGLLEWGGVAYLKGALILIPPKILTQISFFLMKKNPKLSKNDLNTCFPHQKMVQNDQKRSKKTYFKA